MMASRPGEGRAFSRDLSGLSTTWEGAGGRTWVCGCGREELGCGRPVIDGGAHVRVGWVDGGWCGW